MKNKFKLLLDSLTAGLFGYSSESKPASHNTPLSEAASQFLLTINHVARTGFTLTPVLIPVKNISHISSINGPRGLNELRGHY